MKENFKPGDVVVYVGNTLGIAQSKRWMGKVFTVVNDSPAVASFVLVKDSVGILLRFNANNLRLHKYPYLNCDDITKLELLNETKI